MSDRSKSATIQLTWEPAVADRIRDEVAKATHLPYMTAIVGIPGSGKSTSSAILAEILQDHEISTMVMPFDGYHYPLETLQTLPDATEAIYRRGAPDTFDAKALLADLSRIRNGNEHLIMLPGFDHAKGDPEPDAHVFDRKFQNVVICEGLYLLHDQDGWEEIASAFDLTVFVDANIDTCIERLKIRNKCIPGYTPEEIDVRCEIVDRANAVTVVRSKSRASLVVNSAVV